MTMQRGIKKDRDQEGIKIKAKRKKKKEIRDRDDKDGFCNIELRESDGLRPSCDKIKGQ
jgi:hypothetical protein